MKRLRSVSRDAELWLLRRPLVLVESLRMNRRVHILTQRPIDRVVIHTLGLGLSFIPTPPSLPLSSFIPSFTLLHRAIKIAKRHGQIRSPFPPDPCRVKSTYDPKDPDPATAGFLSRSIRALSREDTFLHSVPYSSNLSAYVRRKFLAFLADDSFTIVRADKKMGVCILDTTEYDMHALGHLTDIETYREVKPLRAHALMCQFFFKLHKLCSEHFSGVEDLDNFSPYSFFRSNWSKDGLWRHPKFKILVKIHKSPWSSRPLACSSGSPTYPLSKYLHTEILPVLKAHDQLKDLGIAPSGLSVLQALEDKCFPQSPSPALISHDIASLYPKIPLPEAVESVRTFLSETPHLRPSPPTISFLCSLLHLVLTTNVVNFKGRLFHQIKGGAMGTPVFVVVAIIFMHILERRIVNSFLASGKLLFWARFIDDLFGVFISYSVAEEFVALYNSMHPDIKTSGTIGESCVWLDFEFNIHGRIPADGRLCSSVFQKKLCSFLYLPYASFHTKSARTAFIAGEVKRYVRISVNMDDYLTVRSLFVARLRARGFPFHLITSALRQVRHADRLSLLKLGPGSGVPNNPNNPMSLTTTRKPDRFNLIIPHNPTYYTCKVDKILNDQWPVLSHSDVPQLFENPPRIVFTNPDNLGDMVCKAYAKYYVVPEFSRRVTI